MSKKGADTGYVLLGAGAALALGVAITGVVLYNKRKRQGEYDFLIKIIDANLDEVQIAKQKGSPFDKDYYKRNPKCVSIDKNEAQRQSKILYDSKGTFKDNTVAVEGVFRNVKSKCDVSRIADAFYGMYNTDMLPFLNSFLNGSEMEKLVYTYTNSLS